MKIEIINNNYQIFASDIKLLQELSEETSSINWFNFQNGDNFYSENDEQYQILEINHNDKYVILF